MLKQLRGGAASPSRHIVREIVTTAYQRAREPQCCDPRDLVESLLGVRPCPTRTEVAFIREGLLHYPDGATLPTRGLALYRMLAQGLCERAHYLPVMTELILPELTAKSTPFCELSRVQPHAPLGLVQAIYMSHGRSGTIRVPRLS